MQTLKMRSFARSTTPFVDWPCQYDMLPYVRYFHKGRIKPAFYVCALLSLFCPGLFAIQWALWIEEATYLF
jgi:hypothetical protein